MTTSFEKITSRQYSNMRTRFKPKMSKSTGLLRVPGRELPFTLAQMRDWIIDRAVDKISNSSVLIAYDRLVFRCGYCKKLLPIEDVELDHIVPVKRGGNLGLDNLAIACKIDNQTKGELTADEYRALTTGLDSFPWAARNYILRCLRTAAMGARLRFHPREQKGIEDE